MTTVNQPTFVVAEPAADAEHETEVVPGEEIVVLKTQGDWTYVVVPSHSSTKDERGYPGWLPTAALAEPTATLLAKARNYLGVPYVWGGTTEAGIDCSGLVFRAAEAIGVRLPRDARDQAAALATIGLDEVRPGDLYFFAHPDGRVMHVAIATAQPEPDGVRPMIHADGDKMIVVEELMPPDRLATLVSAARL
ncbi:C40 family peptidase [Nocardioides sp. NPDC058538]|uniref:C40 family peptidase n=1 Tax=Nocardioides sp. NPDC058538 TaxID=3346542 RepID=UPI003665DC0A